MKLYDIILPHDEIDDIYNLVLQFIIRVTYKEMPRDELKNYFEDLSYPIIHPTGAFTDMNKVRVFALAHVLAQVDRTFCKDGKNLFSKVSMLFARNTLNMMMLMRDEYILDHGEPKEGIKHTIPALNVIEKYLAGKKSMINLPYGRSI